MIPIPSIKINDKKGGGIEYRERLIQISGLPVKKSSHSNRGGYEKVVEGTTVISAEFLRIIKDNQKEREREKRSSAIRN